MSNYKYTTDINVYDVTGKVKGPNGVEWDIFIPRGTLYVRIGENDDPFSSASPPKALYGFDIVFDKDGTAFSIKLPSSGETLPSDTET